MPDVSVVIPTRNRLPLLQQTLSTVLGQRGVEVEAIVIDEGSSDATPGWLAAQNDPRLKVVRHDVPVRLPGARNAGVRAASAELVAFVDDDDLWALDKLRLQLEAQHKTGATWSYTGSVHVDEQLNPVAVDYGMDPPDDLYPELIKHNLVPGGGSAVLVSKAALNAVGGFNEQLTAAEDWECWIRLAKAGNKAAAVREPLMAYRRMSHSMSHEIDRMLVALAAVVELHPDIPAEPELGVPQGALCDLARLAREAGEWRKAVDLLWRDRHNTRTVMRAPMYLGMPRSVMRRSFYLRRSRMEWARPLMDEIAHFKA